MSDANPSPESSVRDFAGLLDILGFAADECVSLGYQKPGGAFRTAVLTPADAIDAVNAASTTANMYFGVNPVAGPPRRDAGRGKESDVTRLAALWCDLDVKPGGCADLEIAHAIVDELSAVLGTHPSAIVNSGHGLHPYWPIDDGHVTDIGDARALLRRWGRLVAAVAESHGAKVDSVFDLPRMLRAPGSWNNKTGQTLPVTSHWGAGGPLTIPEVSDRLDEHGISAQDTDRRDRAQVSDPDGWVFADHICNYMSAFIDGLPADGPTPGGGRHQWLLKQTTRLACGWRLGCTTEPGYRLAATLLGQRLAKLRADTGELVGRFEIPDALRYGVETAAAKTDEEARAELGDHPHHDDATTIGDATRPGTDTEGSPRLHRATDLKPATQPRWLARNHLQRAAVNLLIGDEGIGKSLLWVWIAAAVTTGKPLPEWGMPARDPAHVILVCTEDDWSTVVRPRLEVAGADLGEVSVICIEDDGSGAPEFPRDIQLILDAHPVPALVVVDCWLDTVPGELSVRDPQHARRALHPWKEVATVTDAAVLLLAHTNRVASPSPRDRYGATGVLRQKVRLTLYAQSDDDGRLLVGPEKGNNVRADIPASVFAITAEQYFAPTDDSDGQVPRLAYAGVSDRTAREHVAASVDSSEQEPGGNPARAFLLDYLSGQGGWAAAADVIKAGRANGFSEQELKDARRRSKPPIASRKADFSGGWVWALGPPKVGFDPAADEGGAKGHTPPIPLPATLGGNSAFTDRRPGCECEHQLEPCGSCKAASANADPEWLV